MTRRKVGGNFPLESSWIRFGGREGKRRKKKKKEKKRKKKESGLRSSIFSKIYGDRAVGFHRSKRQSSYML